MSDYQHDHMPQDVNGDQRTRVMPPLAGNTPAAETPVVRHRRSDRYRAAAPQEAQQIAPQRQQPAGGEFAAPAQRPQARYVPTAGQQGNIPAGGVPRPAALMRNQEGGAAPYTPGNSGVRRPVPAPGYTQRQPLGTPARMPVQEVRRPAGGDDYDDYDDYDEVSAPQRPRKGHGLLIAVLIIVLVLGLAALGFLLVPDDDSTLGQLKAAVSEQLSGLLGDAGGLLGSKETAVPAAVMDFSAAPTQGTAPLEVAFTLTTTKSVEGVRVVDENGKPLTTSTSVTMDNVDSRIWMLNLLVEDGCEGLVRAEIQDGSEWISTDKTQLLAIAAPQQSALEVSAFVETPAPAPTATATVAATDTPAPTETMAPTNTPTVVPTAAPTNTPESTPTLAPTATPTMAPTAAPTEEPTATPEPTAEPTPAPTEEPAMDVRAAEDADPALISAAQVYSNSEKLQSYNRPEKDILRMPAAGYYTTLPYGVVTFRGDAFRQNAAVRTVEDISKMNLAWTAEAGSVKGASSTYYGIGWTGQPAIIKWSKEVRNATNIVDDKKQSTALKEVIVAGMDGKVYFLDLQDGQPTRDAINVGYPMRGTPSIHPLGYPVMSVGQYARKMAKGTGDIGLRFYNLLNQKQMYMIDGLDGKMKRPYNGVGAFDTSALIDPRTDTMVTTGTNGMLYLTKLNTVFDFNNQSIKMDPSSVVMRSHASNQKDKFTAVESSPAMYANYVFYADMQGVLRCVDTTTMTTAWAVKTGDAVEAAIALDFDEAGNLWLYTANTLQNRSKGDCEIRRYNAMTGEESWKLAVNVTGKPKNKKISGAMASPVVGQNGLSDLVYFTVSNVTKTGAQLIYEEADAGMDGLLLAMDKESGEIVWSKELDSYAYSSPVAVYSEDGEGWIIQASAGGTLYLLDGRTGDEINTLKLDGTIEASPAVYGDTLVIGTTGRDTSYIYGVTLE